MLDQDWESSKNRGKMDDKTRLSWWFPKLPSDIPVPRTVIIPYTGLNLICLLDGEVPSDFVSLCIRIENMFDKEPILHVDYTPDDKYPLRILQAYRENCNVCWQADSQIDSKICDIMNAHCEQRAAILDKAIAILEE